MVPCPTTGHLIKQLPPATARGAGQRRCTGNTPESMQVAGTLALSRSLLAAVDSRPGDVEAPFEEAVELADRTGEGNPYGMGFGPSNVGLWRMYGQLDVYDYEQAVHVGDGLHPEAYSPAWCRPTTGLTSVARWRGYGDAAKTR